MFDPVKHGEITLRRSRFTHFFERGEVVCAYHSLKMSRHYFRKELLPTVQRAAQSTYVQSLGSTPPEMRRAGEELLRTLCQDGLLVPHDYDELTYLSQVKQELFKGPQVRVMVLHLTDYCNLRCRYCFIEGNISQQYQRRQMSVDVMRRSIDFFVRITRGKTFPRRPSIVFYGGEPLINWSVMLAGLEHLSVLEARGETDRLDRILITNGTLINLEIARKLKDHRVMVSLSIDGPQEIHDANRIRANGKGSFQSVMKGFRILREAGARTTVSCVLSEKSLGQEQEIIRHLVDDLGITALGFNHVSIIPNLIGYDPEYEQRYADAILNVQDTVQERYPQVYERRMSHKINNFIGRQLMKADCTGCGEQVSISVNGEAGICQGYMGNRKTFENTVFDSAFDPNEDPVFLEWSNRSPLAMEACLDCPALATCGGGCPRNADVLGGSIWKRDEPFCHFAKKAQEWLIWETYQAVQTGDSPAPSKGSTGE